MRPMIRHTLTCATVFAILSLVRSDSGAVPADPPNPSWAVHALFDLEAPNTGPFPSDWFTVEDPSHNTGRRVNMPLPDCALRVSDCEDLGVINTLDGFNLQPRLSIPFDGPIDPDSATSETIFLISLGSTLGGDWGGRVIGINQVVWDPFTNTLHVESDELLDQHTRYAMIVVSMRETSRDAWSTPMSLGPTINSPSNELGPALSADGTTLYFSSTNRPDGFGGEDLYVSTRVKTETIAQR